LASFVGGIEVKSGKKGCRIIFWNHEGVKEHEVLTRIDACVKSGDRQKKPAISTHQQGQRELLSTFGGGIKIDYYLPC